MTIKELREKEKLSQSKLANIFRYCSGTNRFNLAPRNEPSIEKGKVISADLR